MRLDDFERLIHRLVEEVPQEFLAGVAGVDVSRKTLPHPERQEVYTLGECVPVASEASGDAEIQCRVILYHGSFQALAASRKEFDWRREAWETLTHELRHHLEWRARVPDLEAFDWAAEQNFARGDNEAFDPLFHLSGERAGPDIYRLDDDYFLDVVVTTAPAVARFQWHGRGYDVVLPAKLTLPAFLSVNGVADPPPGELILVFRRRASWLDIFRHAVAEPFQAEATARAVGE